MLTRFLRTICYCTDSYCRFLYSELGVTQGLQRTVHNGLNGAVVFLSSDLLGGGKNDFWTRVTQKKLPDKNPTTVTTS